MPSPAEGAPDAVGAPALWLVDKPAGPTSHDVVATVRRGLGAAAARRRGRPGVKVGHAGTLDPFATGLLVVLVGRATRLAALFSDLDKRYLATVRLGARSVSGDPEGPITPGGPVPGRAELAAAVAALVGPQRQRVPALAAVRVDGERLYRRTRRGETVAAPEREIVVHELRLVDVEGDPPVRLRLDARVSKGTYLRQLAVDLGETLGCGAYCEALRRTAVGPLTLERAVPPEAVGPEGGLDPAEALAHLPARELDAAEVDRVCRGLPVPGAAEPGAGPVALVRSGRLVALAHAGPDGLLRPSIVVRPEA